MKFQITSRSLVKIKEKHLKNTTHIISVEKCLLGQFCSPEFCSCEHSWNLEQVQCNISVWIRIIVNNFTMLWNLLRTGYQKIEPKKLVDDIKLGATCSQTYYSTSHCEQIMLTNHKIFMCTGSHKHATLAFYKNRLSSAA